MSQSVSASIHTQPKERLHAELTQRWNDTGMRRFLLAFEARLAYLEKTPATEVSDGSTCT
jgi:hypothetical protein